MNPWLAGMVVYLVSLALVLFALDWLVVVPRWLAVAIFLGNVALIGLFAGLQAAFRRRRE
jgi:hypothetical protein